jgi:adenine deaminase
MRYVHLYNTQLPQSALGSKTPMQAMKNWHKSHPHLFVKSPRNHTGRDTYMQHSLLALVVIPELRISDKGLIDVTRFAVTNLFVAEA